MDKDRYIATTDPHSTFWEASHLTQTCPQSSLGQISQLVGSSGNWQSPWRRVRRLRLDSAQMLQTMSGLPCRWQTSLIHSWLG